MAIPDIVEIVLSIQPIPGLTGTFRAFHSLWNMIQDTKHSKEELASMGEAVADLLVTLHKKINQESSFDESEKTAELENLNVILLDVTIYVQRTSKEGFLKSVYSNSDRTVAMKNFHRRILYAINTFQVVEVSSVKSYQQKFENARVKDQKVLEERLVAMESNQRLLVDMLDEQKSNVAALMVSIQKMLSNNTGSDAERRFLKASFNYLATSSGDVVEVEPWTISPFDVEFGRKIGGGGFGEVYRGEWNNCPVALKMLKDNGIAASSQSIRKEVKIWERLRHPNLLQFLGANILDDRPFIVMPYLKNGNVKDHLSRQVDCDRFQIILQAARGMSYLHGQNIVHGDIKAVNILIDDGGNAVVADFGLSRIRIDVRSRTVVSGQSNAVAGSRYWMAPELYLGRPAKYASDVYAFGMTIYEVLTDEIPLGYLEVQTLFDAITKHGVRPERPEENDVIPDNVWDLCVKCWQKDPTHRLNANDICSELSNASLASGYNADKNVNKTTSHEVSPKAEIEASNALSSSSTQGYETLLDENEFEPGKSLLDSSAIFNEGLDVSVDSVKIVANPVTAEDYLHVGMSFLTECFGKNRYQKDKLLEKAAANIEKSALIDGGCCSGMYMWARMLLYGWGIKANEKKAFNLLEKAISDATQVPNLKLRKNDLLDEIFNRVRPETQHELSRVVHLIGTCFYRGWGVSKDKSRAITNFGLASDLGNLKARNDLAYCLLTGNGCKPNKYEAASLYRSVVENGGYPPGDLLRLSWIYEKPYLQIFPIETAFISLVHLVKFEEISSPFVH